MVKKWAILVSFFSCFSMASAQPVGLHFDPKWEVLDRQIPHFSLAHELLESPTATQAPIPQAWCYQELAFFCKIEVKMERAARFPIKFRLGDVQYVDWLEQKRPNY